MNSCQLPPPPRCIQLSNGWMQRILFSSLDAALETHLEMIHTQWVCWCQGSAVLNVLTLPKGRMTYSPAYFGEKRVTADIFRTSLKWYLETPYYCDKVLFYHCTFYLFTENKPNGQNKGRDWGVEVKVESWPSACRPPSKQEGFFFFRFLMETAAVRGLFLFVLVCFLAFITFHFQVCFFPSLWSYVHIAALGFEKSM